MRFLGAKVILTPAAQKGSGMLAKAVELAELNGWYLTRQFENQTNADVHAATTAQEILADFAGEPLDYWVTCFGTGGTLKGVARELRRSRPDTRIVVSEPDNSAMLSSGIPQPTGGETPVSHPSFRPHPVQGTSPDFIPKLAADAVAEGWVDHIEQVNGGEALKIAHQLAVREGIFAGISSGASLAAALSIARRAPAGTTILCMLPDTGERYLSTPLFDDVPVDMTDEEMAISVSTPSARFGVAAAAVPAAAAPQADSEAIALVDKAVSDVDQPISLFALEWCEFCWAVRKLFAALGVPYRSVDLDSATLQKADLGGRLRAALQQRTGVGTIPQIFIDGAFVGGASDIFAEARSGRLRKRLREAGFDADPSLIDLDALLPKWLRRAA